MRRAGWWLAVVAGLAVAHLAGHGRLGVASPLRWQSWAGLEHAWGPVVAAVAALRLFVLVAGCYLAALLVLAEAARLPVAGRRIRRLLPRLPAGRLVAAHALGAVAVVGMVVPADALDGPPVMHALAAPAPVMQVTGRPPTTAAPASPPAPTQAAPTQAVPTQAAPAPSPSSAPVPAPSPAPAETPPPAPAAAPAPEPARGNGLAPAPAPAPTDTVLARGDSLWSAADAHMAAALGRRPSEAEVGRYWVRVVEANRARLADPADPDYVLPGFVVALPPL